MRALHTALALETGYAWTPRKIVVGRRSMAKPVVPAEARALIRNMALFLAAPFVGLLYAILLPFVGLGMLIWFGARAYIESGKLRKTLVYGRKAVLVAVAPVAGLVYLIALPFAGLGMLAWFGVKAMTAAPAM